MSFPRFLCRQCICHMHCPNGHSCTSHSKHFPSHTLVQGDLHQADDVFDNTMLLTVPSGQTPESASPTYFVMVYAPMEKPTRKTGAWGYCSLMWCTAAYTSAVKAMCIGLAFVRGVSPHPLQACNTAGLTIMTGK